MCDELRVIDISQFRVRVGKKMFQDCGPDILHKDDMVEGPGELVEIQALADFQGKFNDRNVLNIPGPFYGAMTDTCDTGPQVAPNNVMLDPGGQEFVFRQPADEEEIRQIIRAGMVDPFRGYGADGNSHWSLRLIREWWRGACDGIENRQDLMKYNKLVSIDQRSRFMSDRAEDYLRQYAFFCEYGHLPNSSDRLPNLD